MPFVLSTRSDVERIEMVASAFTSLGPVVEVSARFEFMNIPPAISKSMYRLYFKTDNVMEIYYLHITVFINTYLDYILLYIPLRKIEWKSCTVAIHQLKLIKWKILDDSRKF